MSKLTNCKDCGNQVSKNADSCPNCGAKVKRTSILTWVAAIFIGMLVIIAVLSGASDNPDPAIAGNAPTTVPTGSQSDEVVESQDAPNWSYNQSVDEMRGTTTYTVNNSSKNNIHLGSPYGGGTDLGIIIRHSDELGNEVIVATNNGQLWCEYRSCSMAVKFDDNNVEYYSISRAAAGASEAMFLDGSEDSFISQLKKSKRTMIEIGFYNNGNQQFTFDTADLDWQH